MRIKCTKIDDALHNLDQQEILHRTLYIDYVRRPSAGNPPHAWEIYLQLSGMIVHPDDTVTLVDAGEYCGDVVQSRNGSEDGDIRARELRSRIEAFCAARELSLRPGVLDMN